MPPNSRSRGKPANKVEVDPPSAAKPRASSSAPSQKEIDKALEKSAQHIEEQSAPPTDVHPQPTTPSQAEVEAAIEKSAEHLEEQAAAPTDIHPKPTTPSKAEVEEAVAKSEQFLEEQGRNTDGPATVVRNVAVDAAPVSAGGTPSSLASGAVYGGRDKLKDAKPTFTAPPPTKPVD